MKQADRMVMVLIGILVVIHAPGISHAEGQGYLAQAGPKVVGEVAKKGAGESKVTIVQAIQAALVKVPGRVHELDTVQKSGKLVWEVQVITPEGHHFLVTVDSITGDVTHTEEKTIDKLAGDPTKGKVIFEKECMICHGLDGNGKGQIGETLIPSPVDYTSESIRQKSDAELFHSIQEGRPGTAMRSFRKLGLSNQEIRDVLAYVRILSRGQQK
jgi:mono/diheme cytochrome c family protein